MQRNSLRPLEKTPQLIINIVNRQNFLHNPDAILRYITWKMSELDELQKHTLLLKKNDILFRQEEPLKDLYLLIGSKIELNRILPDGSEITQMILKPGNIVGLIAFTTNEPTLTTAKVIEGGLALKFSPSEFERFLGEHPTLKQPFQQLILHNMVDRYKLNVRLYTKMVQLKNRLRKERDDLRKAYKQLEESHQRLIHQEKMATLGELVAGFAHEVNNPASSLLRSAETLISIYSQFEREDAVYRIFKIGFNSEPIDSSTLRLRMKKAAEIFPGTKNRTKLRTIAQMPDEAYSTLKKLDSELELEEAIQHFEAGKMIHNIRIASNRIANLVKSLKNYSRPEQNREEYIDIREGIKDTVLILSNRLKFLEINLQLNDIPNTCINVSAINQVWTNILVNACDALQKQGKISISTNQIGNEIHVIISDNGPGISEHILPRIFEINFTTKNQGASFGLGLGLPISIEIVRQAGGRIEAGNNPDAGAYFLIALPVRSNC